MKPTPLKTHASELPTTIESGGLEEQGNKSISKTQPAFQCEDRMIVHMQQTSAVSCSAAFGLLYSREVISFSNEKPLSETKRESRGGKEEEWEQPQHQQEP